MIYTMMYFDSNKELAVLRYDTETEFYKFSHAKIPDGVEVGDSMPGADEIQLGYVATASDHKKYNLEAMPSMPDGSPATWLKPMGKFKAMNVDDPTKSFSNAYVLIDMLHQDKAIPRFFKSMLNMLRSSGVMNEDGTHNPGTGNPRNLCGTFDSDGSVKQRTLN